MTFVILVTILMLVQFMYFGFKVGAARGTGNVQAPAMSGDPHFERCNRVHMNTLEQLIVTLPAMWMCAVYFRIDAAAILGAVFIVGRFLYASGYIADPAKRSTGMMIGFFATCILLLLDLYVVVMHFL